MAVLANIIDVNPLTLLVVLVLALLILGPGKLPEVAGALGKSIREFRRTSTDLQDSMRLDDGVPSASTMAATPAPPTAAPIVTAPATPPAPVTDDDPQARIRMLEDRLAALERERGAGSSNTNS